MPLHGFVCCKWVYLQEDSVSHEAGCTKALSCNEPQASTAHRRVRSTAKSIQATNHSLVLEREGRAGVAESPLYERMSDSLKRGKEKELKRERGGVEGGSERELLPKKLVVSNSLLLS